MVEDYNLTHNDIKIYFAGIPNGLLNNSNDLGSDGHPSYRGQRKTAACLVPLMANVLKWSYRDIEIRFSPEY